MVENIDGIKPHEKKTLKFQARTIVLFLPLM